MKTWSPEQGRYLDDDEALQDDGGEEKDVLKVKAKGAPARELMKLITRKTKKKAKNGMES